MAHVRLVRIRWQRVPLALVAPAALAFADLAWKSAVLAAHHGSFAMDSPTSPVKPIATLAIGLLAFGAVLVLPWLCVPGVLLVAGGTTGNIASLALWRAVPNPVGVHVAGGILHFNLADMSVVGGGLLFLTATLWTLWRLPPERFA